MASGRVVSVNTGRASDAEWAGRLRRTAIDKRPAAGPVRVGRLGVAGDEQVDKENHGGYEQALYVYAREDLDWWVERLGRELPDGMFGENITTAGLDVSGARMPGGGAATCACSRRAWLSAATPWKCLTSRPRGSPWPSRCVPSTVTRT